MNVAFIKILRKKELKLKNNIYKKIEAKDKASFNFKDHNQPSVSENKNSQKNNSNFEPEILQNSTESTKRQGSTNYKVTFPESSTILIPKRTSFTEFNKHTLSGKKEAIKKSNEYMSANSAQVKEKTYFLGESKPAEILMMFSRFAMGMNALMKRDVSPEKFKKEIRTPEVQAAIVGDMIIYGTNSKDSALNRMINDFFSDPIYRSQCIIEMENRFLDLEIIFKEAKNNVSKLDINNDSMNEANDLKKKALDKLSDTNYDYQKAVDQYKAANWIINFVKNDLEFDFQKNTMIEEMKRDGLEESLINRRVEMLYKLRSALGSKPNIIEAPPMENYISSPKGSTPSSDQSYAMHAEQRVIEFIEANQSNDPASLRFGEKLKKLYGKSNAEIILAGTKAPCAGCHATEVARTSVAKTTVDAGESANLLRIIRYEDKGHAFGVVPGRSNLLINTVNPHVGKESVKVFDAINDLIIKGNPGVQVDLRNSPARTPKG